MTTMFGPHQLRPRAVLTLLAEGFARWMGAHIAPFRALVAEHHTAVVVQGIHLDFDHPDLVFTDADWLSARTRIHVGEDGQRLAVLLDILAAERRVVHGRLDLRVVLLAEDDSLGAAPGSLPAVLMGRFEEAEIQPMRARALAQDHAAPNGGELLRQQWDTLLCRSACEVADQWSFIEMVELATHARERLFATAEDPDRAARHLVSVPVRSVRAGFRRPLYVFDTCRILTSVHAGGDGGLIVTHALGSPDNNRPHLRIREILDPLS
ncbi:hypothetical protein [Streptomyces sp. NPDC053427]|uniref:hypothetical protein n=1 Tax=Streptomyces sp. NPDC053427 TaxID=3365701 RepID=UPI0037D70DD7